MLAIASAASQLHFLPVPFSQSATLKCRDSTDLLRPHTAKQLMVRSVTRYDRPNNQELHREPLAATPSRPRRPDGLMDGGPSLRLAPATPRTSAQIEKTRNGMNSLSASHSPYWTAANSSAQNTSTSICFGSSLARTRTELPTSPLSYSRST